jgi:hypothetical protein
LCNGACGTGGEQRCQPGAYAAGEALIRGQIIAEDRAYAQQVRAAPRLAAVVDPLSAVMRGIPPPAVGNFDRSGFNR